MAREVLEVIYGKHLRYEVVRESTWLGWKYYVRTSDGRTHGSFDRLDRAVHWASAQAAKR